MGARKQLYECIDLVKSGYKPHVLVAIIRLPSGAYEVITNTTEIPYKLKYYLDAYDDHSIHKGNRDISIASITMV